MSGSWDALGRLGRSWGSLGGLFGRPGLSWGRFWELLGLTWGVLGAFWAVWGCVGAVLGPSWAVLRPCWFRLGAPETPHNFFADVADDAVSCTTHVARRRAPKAPRRQQTSVASSAADVPEQQCDHPPRGRPRRLTTNNPQPTNQTSKQANDQTTTHPGPAECAERLNKIV